MRKIFFYCGKVNSPGGSKISLLNLIYLLKEEKREFQVYVGNKGWFSDKLVERNIQYQVIKEPVLINKINNKYNIFLLLIIFIISFPMLLKNWMKILKQIPENAVVVFNESRDIILFFPLLFKENVNKVFWVRSESPSKLSRILMKKMNKVVTVSDIVKQNVSRYRKNDVYTVFNFMTEKPIYKPKSENNEGNTNLAIIGSIQPIKGQLDAIKAFESLKNKKNKRLYIIGRESDKEYMNEIKDFLNNNDIKDKVVFLGHIDDLILYISKNIHLILVPSQTESFCRVAMEAASVGIPVIGYRVGGLKEVVIEGVTGELVEKDDVFGLSSKIEKVLKDKHYYNHLSLNSRKYWENRFYKDSVKDKLFEIFYEW